MLLLLVALTMEDVKTAECRVACRGVGFDSGKYESDKCLCIDPRDYEEFVNRKRLVLPKLRERKQPPPLEPPF